VRSQTRTLLILWRLANMATVALAAGIVTLLAVDYGASGTRPLWPWLGTSTLAMFVFRYAFYRSLRRDTEAGL
jgi:hypothetical protein